MRKIAIWGVLALMALALAAVPAMAASPHFKGQNSPTFSQPTPTTLNASGALAGLGNYNTFVQLNASGVPDVTCTSPGGNESPGQNPGSVDVSGGQFIPVSSLDKNGNVPFSVTTSPPATITGKQGGCPNNNWTATINSIDFSSATIIVYQDFNGNGLFSANEVVLTQTFTV
jgi:hypothetical protein